METKISNIRKKTGLSQTKFAQKYGIPVRTLQEWEQGRKRLPDYVLHLLEHEVAKNNIKKYLIYYEDTPVMKLLYQGNKLIDSTILTNNAMLIPIRCEVNEFSIFAFLESRCYENGRSDLPEILSQFGMTINNPWEWIQRTHGATFEDCWWIKEEYEDVTWNQIRIR